MGHGKAGPRAELGFVRPGYPRSSPPKPQPKRLRRGRRMDLCAGLSPLVRLLAFSGVLSMIGEKADVGRRQQSQIAVPTRHRVFKRGFRDRNRQASVKNYFGCPRNCTPIEQVCSHLQQIFCTREVGFPSSANKMCATDGSVSMSEGLSTGAGPVANVDLNTVHNTSGTKAVEQLVDILKRGETWPNPIS